MHKFPESSDCIADTISSKTDSKLQVRTGKKTKWQGRLCMHAKALCIVLAYVQKRNKIKLVKILNNWRRPLFSWILLLSRLQCMLCSHSKYIINWNMNCTNIQTHVCDKRSQYIYYVNFTWIFNVIGGVKWKRDHTLICPSDTWKNSQNAIRCDNK